MIRVLLIYIVAVIFTGCSNRPLATDYQEREEESPSPVYLESYRNQAPRIVSCSTSPDSGPIGTLVRIELEVADKEMDLVHAEIHFIGMPCLVIVPLGKVEPSTRATTAVCVHMVMKEDEGILPGTACRFESELWIQGTRHQTRQKLSLW